MTENKRLNAIARVLAMRLLPSQKVLMGRLILMADRNGEVVASMTAMARLLETDRGALGRLLPHLEHANLLAIDRRAQPFIWRVPSLLDRHAEAA